MLRCCLLALLLALSLNEVFGAGDGPSRDSVSTALERSTRYLASISTQGGYLWRYSSDLQQRSGENSATATQIWVQPPGTPSVGLAFLHAYRATRHEMHLVAAEAAAHALVDGQLESGGWAYMIEFDPQSRKKWRYRKQGSQLPTGSSQANNLTTFDDDNTQSAVRFLLSYLEIATNRPSSGVKLVREALEYALDKMLEAQYPNGAWPQRYKGIPHQAHKHPIIGAQIPVDWPRTWPKSDYGGFYTLNDQTQRDCIRTMIQAWKSLGRRECLAAARQGGEFLIHAQLPEPQPGWAQQYNFEMEPAWARAFEPPAVSTAESVGAMLTLLDLFLETGEEKFLKPIPAFIAWLKRSELEPGRWARFYELQSNKPLYGDRDGQLHYTLLEISSERQSGYSWQGSYGIPEAMKLYAEGVAKGQEHFRAIRQNQTRRTVPSAGRIGQILSQQDSQGRWLTSGAIDIETFIKNMNALSAYLLEP